MIECSSSIVEVCVYPGQARVLRRGQVQVPEGTGEIVLPDIPLSLLPETVRVSGRGTAQVRLLGVEVGRAHHEAAPEDALLDLDRRIEQLEDLDRSLALQEEALSHRLEVLAGLGRAAAERMPVGISRGTVNVAAVEELLGVAHKGEIAAREEIRQIEVKRRDLGRKLERLRRERDDRRQPHDPDRYVIRVPVEAVTGGELELDVSYVCQGASWSPLYDLRLDDGPEGPRVVLEQLAEVSQRTGEDWPGVRLSVSTARPALAARVPDLAPWYIDFARPLPAMQLRAGATMAALMTERAAPEMSGMGEEPEAPAPAPKAKAVVAEAEIKEEGAAIVYVAPGAPIIPADGSPRKVLLGTQGLAATLDWVTAPKMVQHVYRRARAQNTSAAALLPGRGAVFYGDTYVGTVPLPETPPQGELEVYLGVDDAVKVKRELIERVVDKGGLVGQNRRMSFGYRLQIGNHRQERVALTVWDQLPTSRDENLKVKLLRSEPPVEVGQLGRLRWDLGLAPGEECEIVFQFQVEMPQDREAVGLP